MNATFAEKDNDMRQTIRWDWAALVLAAMLTTGCGWASAGLGQEIVLVDQPYFFGHGGVQNEPVRTGASIIWWSTAEYPVDMQPRTFLLHFTDIFTSDGVPLEFNAGLKLKVTDSVVIASKYGVWDYDAGGGVKWPGWFGNNLYKPVETLIRQAVKRHGLNETAINPVAVEVIDAEVFAGVKALITSIGLPVELQGFTVGRANPPDAVKHQRIETAAQQQRQQTEQQRKLAEDQRKAAEESRASADNAYRNQMSLSPEQFLSLEAINMQRDVCTKGTCTFIAQGVSVLAGGK